MARPLRVLIVDDNRDAAEMLRVLVELAQHEASVALTGEQAMAVAERERPDVVLLDISLPGISGYDVCRRLRAQPWGRAMLIAAQSGWGGEAEREEEAGFDLHLTKPIDLSALMTLLAARQAALPSAAPDE
jgi:CheY-like chemotaxis protein